MVKRQLVEQWYRKTSWLQKLKIQIGQSKLVIADNAIAKHKKGQSTYSWLFNIQRDIFIFTSWNLLFDWDIFTFAGASVMFLDRNSGANIISLVVKFCSTPNLVVYFSMYFYPCCILNCICAFYYFKFNGESMVDVNLIT